MAPPNGEAMTLTTLPRPPTKAFSRPPRLSNDNLKRSVSDIVFEISKEIEKEEALTAVPEDAKCECCGMCEEYTPEYIKGIRDEFLGKWICGLCSEAVKEEMDKNGGYCREALETHMSHCVRFNKLGRAYPVLCQAQAMREILKKSNRIVRAKSLSPRDIKGSKKGAITRSSSCMPLTMNQLSIRD